MLLSLLFASSLGSLRNGLSIKGLVCLIALGGLVSSLRADDI